jgi:hypothetical protein
MNIIATLWLFWLVYWIVAAWGVKENQRHESRGSRLTHGAATLIGAVLLGVRGILGPVMEMRLHGRSLAWVLVGTVMVAVGLGFAVLARIWLGATGVAR